MGRLKTTRPTETLRRLGRWACGSVGQLEALAGVNVQNEDERRALWGQFAHLYSGDKRVLLDTVMDHCAAIALRRINRGELCLLPSRY